MKWEGFEYNLAPLAKILVILYGPFRQKFRGLESFSEVKGLERILR